MIVGQVKWIEQMTERAHRYGFQNYLASMRSIDIAANALQCDTEYTTKRIIEEGRKAMDEDHAEALILGCTCNFGLAEKVQDILGIPVIDPLIAAVKIAENLANLKKDFGLKPSNKWSSQAPPTEEMSKFGLEVIRSGIPLFLILRGHYWLQNEWNAKTVYKNRLKQKLVEMRFKDDAQVFERATAILPLCNYLVDVVREHYPKQNLHVFVEGIDSSKWYTEKGIELMPMMLAMMDWAEKYDAETEVPKEFITKLRKSPKTLKQEILDSLSGD